MKRPCLPLPAVQAATTKILPTKCLNIADPRIFCPPKITRYTVYSLTVLGVTVIKPKGIQMSGGQHNQLISY